MRVRFTIEALTHIAGIHLFIGDHSPVAATHIVTRIFADVDRPVEFPNIAMSVLCLAPMSGPSRAFPISSSTGIDEEKNEIVVLGIFHGAQDR